MARCRKDLHDLDQPGARCPDGRCRECKRASNQTPKGRASKQAWNQSPKGRAYKRASNQTPKGRASKQAWNQSPKGRASKQAWQQARWEGREPADRAMRRLIRAQRNILRRIRRKEARREELLNA